MTAARPERVFAQGLPQEDPARVIRENPNKKGFVVRARTQVCSSEPNEGSRWTALKSNFPTVPIYDLKFIKRTNDLVVATHGRGLFVLDDITPLEQTGGDFTKSDFHLFRLLRP